MRCDGYDEPATMIPIMSSPVVQQHQTQFVENSVGGFSPPSSNTAADPSEQILKLMQSLGIDANKTREVQKKLLSIELSM